MSVSKNLIFFGVGVAAGVAAVSLMKNPAFKKACATLVGKGLQLKDEAAAFAESVKEDAQDILAEAKYNNQKKTEAKA
ncbi:MAG: DUF6110 family protein [Treponema sp.]|nr:DUF6110 family protein [Treponema sp.]